jgi:hypothetical protein
MYIEPQNGARLLRWGPSVPSYQDCFNASLSTARIPYENLRVGDYVCYRTNEGRLGRFEVEGKTKSGLFNVITIDYRTWE